MKKFLSFLILSILVFTSLAMKSPRLGESEEKIREIFTQGEENSPSIIFIDEIDSIAPKRDEVSGELEKRIVSQLLTLMDGMKSRGRVVVIAATNRPDSIDPALRRPGRFDREIEIGIPDDDGRLDILSIHTRGMPINEKVNLKQIAKTTHGFVGADLEILSKEAAMRSLRRILPEIDLEEDKISSEILQKIEISNDDFREALKEVRPSALREVQVQIPDVNWDDVGGLDELKDELREAVEWPVKHKEAYDYVDVEAPKGVLLYGPPGTGKTLIAKALAKMTESNFISIKGPELLSKWVGESEKGVREIFRKARQAAPCIIFLDEVDALVPRRGSGSSDSHVTENIVSQILTEIDGLEELHNVLIIGATNRLDIVDEALLRPGRFDRIIEIGNPDSKARKHIFEIHTKKKPLENNVDIKKLVEITNGFSGAEIAAITNRAALVALKRYVAGKSQNIKEIKITQQDLIDAGVEVHYLGYYLKWDPQECYYYAVDNTGFEANPERTEGTYSKYSSIDDKIDPFHYFTTLIKFGIGRCTYDAAQEVRNDKITREEAAYLVKKYDAEFPHKYFKEFLNYIDSTEDEFWETVNKHRSPHIWKLDGEQWKLRRTVAKDGCDD